MTATTPRTETPDADAFDPLAFRARVRTWLETNAERGSERQVDAWREPEQEELDALSNDEARTISWAKSFQRALFDAGLAGLTWPVEYGGQGLPTAAQVIYQEEVSSFRTPRVTFGVATNMVVPVLLVHGDHTQQSRHVPAIARGDQIWCQLFSEPNAGSDLAGLRSQAVADGEVFVLNGQKVWTSGAQHADFGLLLARTDPDVPKHRGITAFVLDMSTPGITVRPLRQASGVAHFNEVFFDDVVVPRSAVIGEVNGGWSVAITTLMNERGNGTNKRADLVAPLIELARVAGRHTDPVVRDRLAALWIERRILEQLSDRVADEQRAGRAPGPRGSLLKLGRARFSKRAAELGVELAGPGSVSWAPEATHGNRWAEALLATRRLSIAGGTDEVQLNIIGERILGLPKEPGDDRHEPFRSLLHPSG